MTASVRRAVRLEHRLTQPTASLDDLEAAVALASEHELASLTVNPWLVKAAKRHLGRSRVTLGTVIGFPHGSSTTATKVFEARDALANGATELDMVIQIGALRSGRDQDVRDDIAAVVAMAHEAGAIVKVILENAYLTDEEKERGSRLAEAAGAEFVKTSTGYAPSGATDEDLALMRRVTGTHVQVKAAGGIRTLDDLVRVMNLGVTRIGATQTKAMLDDFRARRGGAAAVAPTTSDEGAY